MFRDYRFQRALFADGGGIFRAQPVKTTFGLRFGAALRIEPVTHLCNFFRNAGKTLRHRLKLQRQLPALAAESLDLRIRAGDFRFQAAGLSTHSRQALLHLGELITKIGRGGHHFHDPDPRVFLLALQFREIGRRRRRFLLGQRMFLLGSSEVSGSRLQHLPVGLKLGL